MGDADRYLWDRSGPPDPDVAALERLLRPLAHDGRGLRPVRRPRLALVRSLAAAAAILLATLALHSTSRTARPDGIPLNVAGTAERLPAGSFFVATSERRRLRLGEVGEIDLAVGSRLQVHRLDRDTARLYLERGEMEARVSVDARPRFFQVGTPATTCVDLGCRYTLTVDDAGNALVRVLTGRVAFENAGQEVFVPRGAICRASRTLGHGTPRYEDAREPFARALDALDAAAGASPAERRALADQALSLTASIRDTLPLWHLLGDRDPSVALAASSRLERIVGRIDGLSSPSGAPPSAADRARWKEHLAPEWW